MKEFFQEASEVKEFFINTTLYVCTVVMLYMILQLFPQY